MEKGFTLIELMITLVIIALLLSFAYPQYHDQLTRMRRHDGQMALLDLACRMEQHASVHHTYQTATLATGKPTDLLRVALSPQGWYTLSITQATEVEYTLQATPRLAQMKDPHCQAFTLNQRGEKRATTKFQGIPEKHRHPCW